MFCRVTRLTVIALCSGVLHASAADQLSDTAGVPPVASAIARAAKEAEPTTLWTLSQTARRPAALPVLYGAYAGLQVMDVVSTRKAIAAGAREANPLMQRGGLAATIAIKAASGVGMVYVSEKMWRKHRIGAIVLMTAMNGVGAAVVAHNTRTASRSRR
jgi:hypothetical protein